MLRIVNARRSQLVDVEAKVILTTLSPEGGRKYHDLDLERRRVSFFPLSWTIVHPITESSPLWEMTREDLFALRAELLVRIQGLDERTSQLVQTRSSYVAEEIRWDVRFRSMFLPTHDGVPRIDLKRLGETEEI